MPPREGDLTNHPAGSLGLHPAAFQDALVARAAGLRGADPPPSVPSARLTLFRGLPSAGPACSAPTGRMTRLTPREDLGPRARRRAHGSLDAARGPPAVSLFRDRKFLRGPGRPHLRPEGWWEFQQILLCMEFESLVFPWHA